MLENTHIGSVYPKIAEGLAKDQNKANPGEGNDSFRLEVCYNTIFSAYVKL